MSKVSNSEGQEPLHRSLSNRTLDSQGRTTCPQVIDTAQKNAFTSIAIFPSVQKVSHSSHFSPAFFYVL
jgi:hypothetical protein